MFRYHDTCFKLAKVLIFCLQVADITYGGRVTDIWDKRSISSILRKYLVPEILEESFTFSDDGVYYAPPPSDIVVSVPPVILLVMA